MGPGILPETTVGKHNPPCHLQMPTKAQSCKKEAICEHGPEAPLCPVGQGSFKMDCFNCGNVFYGQTSLNLTFLLEIMDDVSSGLKRRETFLRVISVQFKSQHLRGMGVHMCIRYGRFACFGRHYECWKIYIKVLEQHMLPSRWHVFQQDNAKPYTAAIATAWLSNRRVWVLNWPACSPDL